MQLIHTDPGKVYDQVYAKLTDEEIEEVKGICERLQNIFLAGGYSIEQGLSIESRSDLIITIRDAVQNGARIH